MKRLFAGFCVFVILLAACGADVPETDNPRLSEPPPSEKGALGSEAGFPCEATGVWGCNPHLEQKGRKNYDLYWL